MPARITCPTCKSSYVIADNLRGKRILCKECSKPMQIPGVSPVVAAKPPQPRVPKKPVAKRASAMPIVLIVGGGLAALFVLFVGLIGIVLILSWKPATDPIPTAHVVKRPDINAPPEEKEAEAPPVVQPPAEQPPAAKADPVPKDLPKPAVEDKSVPSATGGNQVLALKPYQGARRVTLKTVFKVKRNTDDSPNVDYTITEDVALVESMVAVRQGLVDLRMRSQTYLMRMPQKLLIPGAEGEVNQTVPEIKYVHADQLIDAKNNVTKNDIDLSLLVKSPDKMKTDLSDLHNQIQNSLESLSVPLPGKSAKLGETWTAKRPMPLQIKELGGTARIDVTYTFQGVQQRAGRPHGVIAIAGLAKDKLSGGTITGKIIGNAYFDLTACQFSAVYVKGDMAIADSKGAKTTVSLDRKLDRMLAKELLNVRGEVVKDDPSKDEKGRPFKTHTIQLQGGKPAAVSVESPKGPKLFDTFVRVLDAGGKELVNDDDGGVDLNSLAVFTPARTGTYTIKVSSFDYEHMDAAVGDYVLVVRQ